MNVDYAHVYRSIQPLIKNKYIIKDEKEYLSLNISGNFSLFSYIEHLRYLDFIDARNSSIQLIISDILKEINEDFFTIIIFGSSIVTNKFNDLDILIIIDDMSKIEKTEKNILQIINLRSIKVDCHVVSKESVYEMLSNRNKLNVINEIFNKHIIPFGAENFYRMIKDA